MILKKLIYYLKSEYKEQILKIPFPKKKKLTFLFNFLSIISGKKDQSIIYKDGFYYFKSKKKLWKFYDTKHSLFVYFFGIEKRVEYLKKSYFLDKIDFYDDDIVIDVGANNGDLTWCFEKKIKYIGIEASPKIFECLKHNTNTLKATLFNNAAWKKDREKINFYLKDDGADSSIFKPLNFKKIITTETITIDEIISNIKINKVKLLKIEAEGAEPEVLLGVKNNMSKISYITIDVSAERGETNSHTITECVNILSENNFEFSFFYIEGKKNERVSVLFKNKLL